MKKTILLIFLFVFKFISAQYRFESIDINPTGDANPALFMEFNGKMFFSADDGVVGREPWISDGTKAGTFLLNDATLGAASSVVIPRFIFNNELFFTISDNTKSYLWKTDGTASGTNYIKSFNMGVSSFYISSFVVTDSFVLFAFDDGFNGMELWTTNGKRTGTYLLKDIYAGVGSSYVKNFAQYKGKVYFSADDGIHGTELWVTDGTASGTNLLKDIELGSNSSDPRFVCFLKNKMLFKATTSAEGVELYLSDGTASGTNIIMDLNPGVANGFGSAGLVANDSDTITKYYFIGSDGINYGIFQTDGTSLGTSFISSTDVSSDILVYKGNMYFISRNAQDLLLMSFDGTSAGLKSIDTLFNHVKDQILFKKMGNLLCTSTYDIGYNFMDLHLSTGTKSGSHFIKFLPGFIVAAPSLIGTIGSSLIFIATDSSNIKGQNLFVTQGLETNTIMLTPPNATFNNPINYPHCKTMKNQIFLSAKYTSIGRELWIITDTSKVATPIRSIEENKKAYSLYPNPAFDIFHININEDSKLEMYDVTGKLIADKFLYRGDNVIDLSNNSEGMYFISIAGNAEKLMIRK